ncbi:MAG: apolipoprotein N-acyltransferase [bacterium]|nr:apolipoprotein N-acyltransferase [bacterium]
MNKAADSNQRYAKSGIRRKFFFRGLVYGFIIMLYFHRWMLELQAWAAWYYVVILWVAASLFYALFYGTAMFLYAWGRNSIPDIYLFPACWIFAEWLRTAGPVGSSAGALGYSQSSFLPVLQTASGFGLYGLSFFIVLCNVLLWKLISGQEIKKHFIILMLVSTIVFLSGWRQLSKEDNMAAISKDYKEVKAAIIQANHEQSKKMQKKYWPLIRQDYINMTLEAVKGQPDIVIWPETITPVFNLESTEFIRKLKWIADKYKISIIFGTPVHEDGKYYNAAVVIDDKGINLKYYKKTRLMPFGEYWPAKNIIKFFDEDLVTSDYERGNEPMCLSVKELKVAGGICLESIYPEISRKGVNKGADILCFLANNAWFFGSIAAEELFQMSILRAVENDRFMIQVSNTGISGLVSNKGKVIAKMQLNKKGIINESFLIRDNKSLYSITGNIFVYISIILIIYSLLLSDHIADPK